MHKKIKSSYHLAIVGATGAVGQRMLSLLEKRHFPVSRISAFASAHSTGKILSSVLGPIVCQSLKKPIDSSIDCVFFDASDEVSATWVPHFLDLGIQVIDNSSVFRMQSHVPLIIPEINAHHISQHRLIAGPNCSAVPISLALYPILKNFGLTQVIASTYQSVSGAGQKALLELKRQNQAILNDTLDEPQAPFEHTIANTCIPKIGSIQPDGYSSEEHKIIEETKKILQLAELSFSVTAVRVPIPYCHAQSVSFQTSIDFSREDLIAALKTQIGLMVIENQQRFALAYSKKKDYPEVTHSELVYISRIRKDLSQSKLGHFWILSDNLMKGAALNAIQIAEHLYSV